MIYSTELIVILQDDGTYKSHFRIDEKEGYKYNKKYDHFTYQDGYDIRVLPVSMTVETSYLGYPVIKQAFKDKPSKKALVEQEKLMKEAMAIYLEQKKQETIDQYDAKLACLR